MLTSNACDNFETSISPVSLTFTDTKSLSDKHEFTIPFKRCSRDRMKIVVKARNFSDCMGFKQIASGSWFLIILVVVCVWKKRGGVEGLTLFPSVFLAPEL